MLRRLEWFLVLSVRLFDAYTHTAEDIWEMYVIETLMLDWRLRNDSR